MAATATQSGDADLAAVVRTKEENQERFVRVSSGTGGLCTDSNRAFIAASRRKDRSLDARLESAHRASQLHKKRTGKALHITREIVESEAMYEEVDERYHEKRMLFMRGHNEDLEAEFRRQLLMALGVNGSHPLNPAAAAAAQRPFYALSRVSSRGAVQKAVGGTSPRPIDVAASSSASYSEPMTPASVGLTPPPTTTASDYYAPSYVQTPGYATVTSHPTTISSYMSTTPDMTNGLYQTSSILAWSQSLPSPQMIHHGLPSGLEHAPRQQRLASAPDVLMVQAHHANSTAPVSTSIDRAKSEPMRAENEPAVTATALPPTTAADWESPPPMTAGSSSTGPGGEDGGSSAYHSTTGSFSSPGEWLPEANNTAATMMCSAPGQDPDLDEFTRYARGLGSGQSWMNPMWDTSALGFDELNVPHGNSVSC